MAPGLTLLGATTDPGGSEIIACCRQVFLNCWQPALQDDHHKMFHLAREMTGLIMSPILWLFDVDHVCCRQNNLESMVFGGQILECNSSRHVAKMNSASRRSVMQTTNCQRKFITCSPVTPLLDTKGNTHSDQKDTSVNNKLCAQ